MGKDCGGKAQRKNKEVSIVMMICERGNGGLGNSGRGGDGGGEEAAGGRQKQNMILSEPCLWQVALVCLCPPQSWDDEQFIKDISLLY